MTYQLPAPSSSSSGAQDPRKFVYRSIEPTAGSPLRRKTDPPPPLASSASPSIRLEVFAFRICN